MEDIPFGKILSSIGQGVVVFDERGFITYVNPHASLLLDRTSHELVGRKIDDVFKILLGEKRQPVKDKISDAVIVNKKPYKSDFYDETMFLGSREMFIPISIVATPMFVEDKITGGIVSFKDITFEEEKRLELLRTREEVAVLGKELENKREIENMNSLMIGRELKMAEMKEEMEKLKIKLEGHLKA